MTTKIDEKKGLLFVECYTKGPTAGNAMASAKAAGWTGSRGTLKKMGSYLKDKYRTEIMKKTETLLANNKAMIATLSEEMIDVMVDVARNSQNDMSRIKSAKEMLDYAGYSNPQNINLNVEKEEIKNADASQLGDKYLDLATKIPGLKEKLLKKLLDDNENSNLPDIGSEEDENRLKH